MSTRGAVLFEVSNGCYEVYYNHCDSYPTWLGVKLAELLKAGKTADEIIEALELKSYQKVVSGTFGHEVARQVYPGLQGDLEWIYVVNFNPPSLQVFRTSNPDLIDGPDFVFFFILTLLASLVQTGHSIHSVNPSRLPEAAA